MWNHDCAESRKVTGKIRFDLSRTDNEKSMYSAQFRVVICVECGRAELFCDPHEATCEWLDGGSESPKHRAN